MRSVWVSALALTAGMSGAASAQDAVLSDDIVVTVQLREQQLFDVPMAVNAYSQDTLDRLGVSKYDELSLYVPGFEVQEQSANNTGFVIRGITSDSGSATTEPRIAVFQDGVSTSRNRGSYVELFDLERIEVARGPQATLYGRGALIGAVNVVQHRADLNDASAEFQIEGGEDGYMRGLTVLNAPIVNDVFGVRFAATVRERDGYVENTLGGEDLGAVSVGAARLAMSFAPSDNLTFDYFANVHNDDNSGTPFKSGTFAPAGGDASPYSPAALNTFGDFENGAPLGLDREVTSHTLIGEWTIDPALSLTSITGYREFESLEIFDPDGSAYPLMVAAEDAEGEQFSQEFRLAWDNGGRVSGFVGASYFHEEGSQRAPTQFDERYAFAFANGALPATAIDQATFDAFIAPALIAGIDAIPGVSTLVANAIYAQLDPAHTEYYTNSGETTSYDVFADATWRVTDRFEITGGLRYTHDDKTSSLVAGGEASALGNLLAAQTLLAQAQAAALAGDPVTAAALQGQATAVITAVASGTPLPYGLFTQPGAISDVSDEFDAVTWRLIGRYEFSDQWAGWASYARGRRPEVIDVSAGSLPGSSATSNVLPAEMVDSYEIGLRGQDLFGGALDLDGSVYYYEYTDFQTTEFNGAQLVTVNAGEATAYGFETSLRWRPFDHFDMFATYAYSHARFEDGAREGNSFRLSPDHSASIGFTYEIPTAVGDFYFTPSYTWQSKIYFDDDNDRADLQPSPLPGLSDAAVDEVQDGYGLLNLRAGFEHQNGHWGIEAFVKNALDEEYLIDAGNTGDSLTIPTFIRGAPRLVGVQLSARF